MPQVLGKGCGELVDRQAGGIAGEDGTFAEICLLYTSDAADERSSVDLGGRRIIKKKNRIGVSMKGIDAKQR